MKAYGWRYNQRGMGDVARGSVIRWAGNAPESAVSCLFCTNRGAFQDAIEKRGFSVVSIEGFRSSDGMYGGHWWVVTAIAPATGTVEGAGSFITAAAYEVFGDVLTPTVIDITDRPIETPEPTVTPVPLPAAPSSQYTLSADGITASLDSFAGKLGLGIGAGSGIALIALAFVGIVILKK